jgi:hypothetical protein
MTLKAGELVEQLLMHDEEAKVVIEGCDCDAYAGAVSVDRNGDVVIERG